MTILQRSNVLVLPTRFIKERLDQAHQRDWEDPDRYERLVKAALTYIPERARTLVDGPKLLWEVRKVFHDDLNRDPRIIEAVQRAVHTEELSAAQQEIDVTILPSRALLPQEREVPRGVDKSESSLAALEREAADEKDDF